LTVNRQEETSTEAKPYEKYHESDGEMLLRVGKKFTILITVILLSDTIIDMICTFADFAGGLLHLFIEFIEYSLEVLVEHVLHADHHQSETIIVNAALLISFYLFYKFYFVIYEAAIRKKRAYQVAWIKHIRREAATWEMLTLARKIKVVITYFIGISLVLFLITL
jgi:hypothetical protein